MKYLSDRYVSVCEYKGYDICTLKSACPSEGDETGFVIDDGLYDGMVFNHPGDAMAEIDRRQISSNDKGWYRLADKYLLVEQYTEETHTMEELIQIFKEKALTSRKDAVCLEFITTKPVYNDHGEVIAVTTDFPAELNVYKGMV